MRITLRSTIVPAYLFLCMIVGGSAQGVWANMALQLLAIAILAWTFLSRRSDEPTAAARQMVALIIAAGVLVVLQIVPLPASVWTQLPGRGPMAQGFEILGYPLPALSLSLTPYSTLTALLAVLPGVAVYFAASRVWQRQGLVATSILVAAFAGVLLGALQVSAGGSGTSPWYLYPVTNRGAVGFFANSNHMGSLLLVCIPFALAILASSGSRAKKPGSAAGMTALGLAGLLAVASGLVLNRSLAALGIAVPVLLFSALLLPGGWKFRRLAVPVGSLALLGAMLLLMRTPISAAQPGSEMESFQTRTEVWSATAGLVQQYFPAGTGLGSFSSVFRFSEDPASVDWKYVNHAHNDYLELLLELGAPGAILLLLFLAWWLVQTVRVWRSGLTGYYARAATIASGALLAHSLVDYPLRTAALSSIFGLCLAFMAQPKPPKEANAGDSRPVRHMALG